MNRDGCGCPPEVERCCHHEDGYLNLASWHVGEWQVISGDLLHLDPLTVRTWRSSSPVPWGGDHYHGCDYDAALAAFYAAEAKLLGRDA